MDGGIRMKDITKLKKQLEKISKLQKENKKLKELCEKLDKKVHSIKHMLNEITKIINNKEFYL